jgi:hypothetical protein
MWAEERQKTGREHGKAQPNKGEEKHKQEDNVRGRQLERNAAELLWCSCLDTRNIYRKFASDIGVPFLKTKE